MSREHVSITEELRARIEELTRERDEARAELDHACREGGALYEAKIELAEVEQERDEARAGVDKLRSQIERLRGVLHIVSLDEYESTTSASEKVHAHARQARIVLNETLADATPSDAAHIASLENLFIKACRRAEKHELASRDAFRRGAEAMRETCARAVEDADDGAPLQMLADDGIRTLPIPEDKP